MSRNLAGSTSRYLSISDRRLLELITIASPSQTDRGYSRRRYARTAGLIAMGMVEAWVVLVWMTSDQAGLTSGAIRVFRTSIRLNGRRIGLYRCSVKVRSERRSLDHGNMR